MLCFVEAAGRIKPSGKEWDGVGYFSNEEEARSAGCHRIVNLDDAVIYMKKFTEKTFTHAKKFKKFGKKMNGKNPEMQKQQVRKWAKNNIYSIFEHDFLKKMFPDEAYSSLPEEDLLTMAVGGFIPAHALADEIDAPTIFKMMARDLALRIYAPKK